MGQMTICNVKALPVVTKQQRIITLHQFGLTALINTIASSGRQMFFFGEKALINPLHTTCPGPDDS